MLSIQSKPVTEDCLKICFNYSVNIVGILNDGVL
jgi:hypothetical protein